MPKLVKTEVNVEGRITEEYAVIDSPELPAWEQNEELAIVGQPAKRLDGPAKTTGEARYTFDVQLPGMLYAAVLRSPHPNSRVVSVDARQAEKLPGVVAILTTENAPDIKVREGKLPLMPRDARFAGELVAAVAATDPQTAEDALALIAVEYEQLPYVTDFEQALAPDAPQVKPNGNIANKPNRKQRGDAEAGLAEADVVIEITVRTPTAVHNALETHGCVANWEGDQLTLYESTQHTYGVRAFAARKLDLPLSKVRAIGTFMGGGFGSKFPGQPYTLIAATLAKRSRRPVHLMYDREGEHREAGYRGATVQHVKLGAKRDGRLTAIVMDGLTECGSYANWVVSVGGPYELMYGVPNLDILVTGVHTNLGPFQAFRAPGFVEGMVGLEQAMDVLAERLQIDPLELRRKNLATFDQAEDKPFSSFPVAECYRRGAEAIGWSRRRPSAETRGSRERYRRGLGMSSQIWWGGGGPPAYTEVQLNSDGTATVLTGVQDLGTGARTIFAQVAAEELGLSLKSVNVTIGDTYAGPFGPASGGSITTGSMTPAVRAAANDVRTQFCSLVAQLEEVPEEEIEVRDGVAYRRDDKIATVRDVMRKLGDVMLIGKGSRGPNPDDVSVVTSGAQFAEVEVDTVTGRVRVLKIVAAHDSGRIVNPQTFTSQIQGGILQGLGLALTEERIVDHNEGQILNPNLEWYKIPTTADTPEIVNLLIDIADTRANSIGAKGAGEPGIIPTAAAIANAVANALGVRITDLPITPGRVLEAINA